MKHGKIVFVGCLLLGICLIATHVEAGNFKCSNITDGFRKGVGVWGDQCIIYVRYETGIEHGCCNGNAENCYPQAEACGYSVGSVPKLNAIMVMDSWSGSSVGHDAIVIELDSNDSSRVKVRDSNWDKNKYTKEHWIDTDSSIYNDIRYVYCEESTHIPYAGVSEGNVSIYWTPANVSCINATGWRYNGMSTAYPGTICFNAYNELKNINFFKYNLDDWYYTFFGNQSQYNSTQYCGSN